MNRWFWRFIGALIPLQTAWLLGGVVIDGGLSEYARVQLPVSCLLIFATWLAVRAASFTKVDVRRAVLYVMTMTALFVASLFRSPTLPTVVTIAVFFQILSVLCLVDLVRSSPERRRGVVEGFLLMMTVSVVIGFYQVIFGRSPASTIFGMSGHDAATLGDSVLLIGGHRVLRAYGLFPHPNVFAGYLVVATWFVAANRDLGRRLRRALLTLFVVGLLMTASRAGILALAAMLIVDFTRRRYPQHEKRTLLATLTVIVMLWAASLLLPGAVSMLRGGGVLEVRSIVERREQLGEWRLVFSRDVSTTLFGTGFRGYTLALQDALPGSPVWRYQPVHDTLLLALAEFGLLGCAHLVFTLRRIVSTIPAPLLAAVFALMMFDHYLLTIPAGLLLLGLVLTVDESSLAG